MSTTETKERNSLPVRGVTESLFKSLIFDVWPTSAGIVDFGIASHEHYAALQFAVLSGGLTVEELDDACGCGPALTALITDENPYHGVRFTTTWDTLMVPIKSWAVVDEKKIPLGRLFATPEALSIATRAEVNAALVRHAAGDWGEADTAESEDAMREGREVSSRYRLANGCELYVRTSFHPPMTLVLVESELEY